ncbi:MAG TPA: isoprenylcysteine carboxylmethyltransferase family protein [Myxococcales bacterium]|nr:isoprenylcysteine carboxylmethyltransferase family protein [Myxococcales bacterium]
MQTLGRFLFRWRSFTPVPLLLLALPLLWLGRGPAPAAWLACGIALCVLGQALRAWVLGQVPDGTSGQNEKLIAVSLNVSGPYAHTRNPLYLGNLLITLGLCAVAHSWALLLAIAVLFGVQYRAIIAAEEEFLRSRFGAEFDAYCARVPRFWPRLRAAGAPRPYDWRRALKKEHNPCAAWVAIALALLLRDHPAAPRPYVIGLAITALSWLAVKAWKHRWLSGNFLADFRRRLRETVR